MADSSLGNRYNQFKEAYFNDTNGPDCHIAFHLLDQDGDSFVSKDDFFWALCTCDPDKHTLKKRNKRLLLYETQRLDGLLDEEEFTIVVTFIEFGHSGVFWRKGREYLLEYSSYQTLPEIWMKFYDYLISIRSRIHYPLPDSLINELFSDFEQNKTHHNLVEIQELLQKPFLPFRRDTKRFGKSFMKSNDLQDLEALFQFMDTDNDGVIPIAKIFQSFFPFEFGRDAMWIENLQPSACISMKQFSELIGKVIQSRLFTREKAESFNEKCDLFKSTHDESHLREAFHIVDLDGNGFINRSKYLAMLSATGQVSGSEGYLNATIFFKGGDTNHDGKLDESEFIARLATFLTDDMAWTSEQKNPDIEEKLSQGILGIEAAFDIIDSNHDGVISLQELHENFATFRRDFKDEIGMMNTGDTDHDGVLNKEEFFRLLSAPFLL